MLLQLLNIWVLLILYWVAVPVGLYACIHAMLQRVDAYPAADKLTKPAWVGITGGAVVLLLFNVYIATRSYLLGFTGFDPGMLLFYLIALVAVLVYLVDVKPAVTEVQRGPRW